MTWDELTELERVYNNDCIYCIRTILYIIKHNNIIYST